MQISRSSFRTGAGPVLLRTTSSGITSTRVMLHPGPLVMRLWSISSALRPFSAMWCSTVVRPTREKCEG